VAQSESPHGRRRAVVLLNPAARRADHASSAALTAALGPRWSVDLQTPASAAATTRAAAQAAAAGVDVVIAAGGDGTAADVARGLVGTDTALALYPLGTANDLARALALPRDPAAAVARLATSTPRAVDLVSANGRLFCTVGGIGVVADSALTAGRLKSASGLVRQAARAAGSAIYRLTAPWALMRRVPLASPVQLVVTTPSGAIVEMRLDSPGLFVANQRHCGGGLTLPGVGADDDGVFEVLLIRDVSRVRLLDAFSRLTLRLPIADAVLQVIPARAARIVCARDETFLGDGDALGVAREFDVRAVPRALNVLA